MRESTTTGMISLDGPGGLVYEVGAITYLVREDESFRYTFVPNWPVIDLLEPPLFQGVPGTTCRCARRNTCARTSPRRS